MELIIKPRMGNIPRKRPSSDASICGMKTWNASRDRLVVNRELSEWRIQIHQECVVTTPGDNIVTDSCYQR